MDNLKLKAIGHSRLFWITVVVIAVFMLCLFVGWKASHPKLSNRDNASLLGKPCSITSPIVNTDGFQCYYYGTLANDQTIRNALWMIPNLPTSNSFELMDQSFYNSVTASWNAYTSHDGTVSFRFPDTFHVSSNTSQDEYQISLPDGSPLISIDSNTLTGGYVGTSTRIEDIVSDNNRVSQFVKESVLFDRKEAVVLKVAAKTNIQNDNEYLFVDLGDRQVEIHVIRFNDSFYDFISDAILTTLRVR